MWSGSKRVRVMRTAVAAGSGSGGCSPSSFRDLFRKLLLSGPCRVVNETLWGSVMAMAKSYQASRHRSHCIWKGLSGISPRVTEDDGSRTSTLLLEFSREVTKGRGVSACCNHQREERKNQSLCQSSLQTGSSPLSLQSIAGLSPLNTALHL